MLSKKRTRGAAVLAVVMACLVAGGAWAQAKKGSSKIICWKDKDGKVVGCGDRVPPEYQNAATKELDRRGLTRKTTETAEERARREAKEREDAQRKAQEQKRLAEQRRQDSALLNTFSSEKEIDLKRDRDLAVVDTQITQMRSAHKLAAGRQREAKARYDAAAKGKKTPPAAAQEELQRADADLAQATANLARKEKERDELSQRYIEMKKRYIELKGGGSARK